MPIRHYLTLFVMAVAIGAGLLAITFEERLSGSDDSVENSSGHSDQTGAQTLAGIWDTSYGPMTISVESTSPDGHVEHVSGSWQQGNFTGIVTSGTFDRRTGIFQFQFSEPWHQKTGSAQFVLNEEGTFSGTWTFTGSTSASSWSMQRPGLNSSSSVIADPLDCPSAPPTMSSPNVIVR